MKRIARYALAVLAAPAVLITLAIALSVAISIDLFNGDDT